jgi:hypothetical protein
MPVALDIPQFTDAASSHPFLIRVLNRLGRIIPRGRALTAEAVWDSARKAGLEGCEPTPEAREALGVLMQSLAENARMTLVGRYSARDDTIRLAKTHLRIHRALRESPEVAGTPLPPPVFIVGWPRTGTTFLHQLLARDPAHRTLPYWESFDPVPAAPGTPDKRIEKLDEMLKLLSRIEPRYDAIHPMTAEAPEECVALFMNEFRSLQLDFQYQVPEYARWLLAQDARIAYRLHRRQLELVQFHRPSGERLVLKDPTHLVHLAALLEVYPDAKIVFTHRDPAVALSSICSLVSYTRALFTDDVDPHGVGTEILSGYWPDAMEDARELRKGMSPEHAVDVRHADLQRDPLGTVERIYSSLGFTFSESARTSMRRFVDDRRKVPIGKHMHSLEGFGLSRSAVRERFSSYCTDFDL